MLNEDKKKLLQIEFKIQIIKYHIELLAKLFPFIIKENPNIRTSTANEINKICDELESVLILKNKIINKIH